jgi:hypothetical protein
MKQLRCIVFGIAILSLLSSSVVSACAQSPCLLFNATEVPAMWAKLSQSQFFSRIPQTISTNTVGISSGSNPENKNAMNAAVHCVLNPANTAQSPPCTSAKAAVLWAANAWGPTNGYATITTSNFTCGACGTTAGGHLLSYAFAFDWLRAKNVFTPQEEALVIQWFEYAAPIVESAYTSSAITSNGNAALTNYAVPMAAAIYAMYQVIEGHPSATLPQAVINQKISTYAAALKKGADDFGDGPIEGMNYHVYTYPALMYAGIAIEKRGHPPVINQVVGIGTAIGDLFMGSENSGIPNCPPSGIPLATHLESGKWFMYHVEGHMCSKGIHGFTLAHLPALTRLHATDPWTAKRGISRVFKIDTILGPSGGRSDALSSMPAYILPALFYDDALSYATNLDAAGYVPAAYHKDQKNAAPPEARYNGFDLDGQGGLHSIYNTLEGTNRVGSLFINYDGTETHKYGSASGGTEKFAGSFPVEISPGRGDYVGLDNPANGPGHRLADQNHFLPDSSSSDIYNANINYYNPNNWASSEHNHEGTYAYHLEGYFASGAESQNKRVWQMSCASCLANRFVGMVSEPDADAYVVEFAETRTNAPTTIRKRTHSFVQATAQNPGTGQTIGYGYRVELNGNKGITRFFHPQNPQKNLTTAATQMLDRSLYENQIMQTTTGTNQVADWFYITELIVSGNNRASPNMYTLPVPSSNGYAGVIDWNSNNLNRGYKDYIFAKKTGAVSLSIALPEISIASDARIAIIRKNTQNNQILHYALFDAQSVIVDGVSLLTSPGEKISVSINPSINIQTSQGSNQQITLHLSASMSLAPIGSAPFVFKDGQALASSLYALNANTFTSPPSIAPPPLCVNGASSTCYPSSQYPNTLGVGICTNGTQMCTNGQWGACGGAITPQTETCNDGLDNNCNGVSDCLDSACTSHPTCVSPQITLLQPEEIINTQAATISIFGSGFHSGSGIYVEGFLFPSILVSPTLLQTSVTALPNAFGQFSIQVRNTNSPNPTTLSNTKIINLTDPKPYISSATPNQIPNNAPATILFIGDNFTVNSLIRVAVSGNQLPLIIPSESSPPDQISLSIPQLPAGQYSVSIENPLAQSSNQKVIEIIQSTCPTAGCPIITSQQINITNDQAHTISLQGTGFQQGAIALIGFTEFQTNFLSSQVLEIIIPQYFQTGVYALSVRNPDNGVSNSSAVLIVEESTPVLNSIQPNSLNTAQTSIINLSGFAFYPNATIELTLNNQTIPASGAIERIMSNEMHWTISQNTLSPGIYEIAVKNPGGSRSNKKNMTMTQSTSQVTSSSANSGSGGGGGPTGIIPAVPQSAQNQTSQSANTTQNPQTPQNPSEQGSGQQNQVNETINHTSTAAQENLSSNINSIVEVIKRNKRTLSIVAIVVIGAISLIVGMKFLKKNNPREKNLP